MRLALASWVALLTISSSIPASAQDFAAEMAQLEQTVRMLRTVEERAAIAPAFAALAARAFEDDEFSLAESAWNFAARLVPSDRQAVAAYQADARRARDAGRAYDRIRRHIDSEEPAARRQVAEFYAFVKGEWERALPDLANGDDPIARAAKIDMAHLADEAEAVGDAWVAAARRYSTHATALYARAGVHYRQLADTAPTPALMQKLTTHGLRVGYDPAPPAGAVQSKGIWLYSPAPPNAASRWLDKLVDGQIDNGFWLRTMDDLAWVAVDLRQARKIKSVAFAPVYWERPDAHERDRQNLVGATIQVSNSPDFANAVTVHTITEAPVHRQLTFVPVDDPGVWRFVRVKAARGELLLGEFRVYH